MCSLAFQASKHSHNVPWRMDNLTVIIHVNGIRLHVTGTHEFILHISQNKIVSQIHMSKKPTLSPTQPGRNKTSGTLIEYMAEICLTGAVFMDIKQSDEDSHVNNTSMNTGWHGLGDGSKVNLCVKSTVVATKKPKALERVHNTRKTGLKRRSQDSSRLRKLHKNNEPNLVKTRKIPDPVPRLVISAFCRPLLL